MSQTRKARTVRSKSCHTCRERHIKCDEAEPSCANCLSRGLDCPGPVQGLIFLDMSMRTAVARPSREKRKKVEPYSRTDRGDMRPNKVHASPQEPSTQVDLPLSQSITKSKHENNLALSCASGDQYPSVMKSLEFRPSGAFPWSPDVDESTAHQLLHYAASQLLPTLFAVNDNSKQQSFWIDPVVNHPALFNCVLAATASHVQLRKRLDQPQPQPQTREEKLQILARETEGIRYLNMALGDPNQACSDEVVLAILCLGFGRYNDKAVPLISTTPLSPLKNLQWLETYSFFYIEEANLLHHMAGLVRIIAMKGGLGSIKLEGLAPVVSGAGLLLASKMLCKPLFPFWSLTKSKSGHQDSQPDWPPAVDLLLSTYGDGGASHQNLKAHLPDGLVDIFQDMCSYNTVLQLVESCILKDPNLAVIADRRNSIQHRLMSLPSIKEWHDIPLKIRRIYEPCRIALILYSIQVIFPLPRVIAPLSRLTVLLRQALIGSDLQRDWNSMPEFLLWILLIGGIASPSSGWTKTWFVATLRHFSATKHIESWGDIKPVLKSIIWLDSTFDPDAERVWNEIGTLDQ